MDNLKVLVNNQSLEGWTAASVTRGIEICPSHFECAMADPFPGARKVLMQAGDPVQIMIDDELVLTGYIDKLSMSIDASRHIVNISGRGKCQDLVDCSAEWPTGQVSGNSVVDIANKMGHYYEITASLLGFEDDVAISQFNINWGQTAFEILNNLATARGTLLYEGRDGNLIIARTGSAGQASALVEGQNLESLSLDYSMNERFSEYQIQFASLSTDGGTFPGGEPTIGEPVFDKYVKRNRKKFSILATQSDGRDNVTWSQIHANWDCTRRMGKSTKIECMVDSWHDAKGQLWDVNKLVSLSAPSLKLENKEYLIGAVTFAQEGGTKAHLTLQPKEAFTPEPTLMPEPLPANEMKVIAAGRLPE